MAPPRVTLQFVSGSHDGQSVEVPIGSSITLGSGPDCDVVLTEDSRIAARHATLSVDETGIWLEDHETEACTFVNGERITRRRLVPGTRVLMGRTVFDLTMVGRAPGGLLSQSHWLRENGSERGSVLQLDQGVYIVGRSELAADVRIDEPNVARCHVRITIGSARVTVEDLDSLSGTRVDGELVEGPADLGQGSLLAIGEAELRLVNFTQAGVATLHHSVVELDPAAVGRSDVLAGLIEQVALSEVLQVLSTSRRKGCLVVRGPDDVMGRIFVSRGRIDGVLLDDDSNEEPTHESMREAFSVIAAWPTGVFHFEPLVAQLFDPPMDVSIESMLIDVLGEDQGDDDDPYDEDDEAVDLDLDLD